MFLFCFWYLNKIMQMSPKFFPKNYLIIWLLFLYLKAFKFYLNFKCATFSCTPCVTDNSLCLKVFLKQQIWLRSTANQTSNHSACQKKPPQKRWERKSTPPARTWAHQTAWPPRHTSSAASHGHSWPRRARRPAHPSAPPRRPPTCACAQPNWSWSSSSRSCGRSRPAGPARQLCAPAHCAPAPTCN